MDKEDVFIYVCVCVYITEYCSDVKKNEIMPFIATWMDLEIMLSKVSQTENIYMLNQKKKKDTNKLISKRERDSQTNFQKRKRLTDRENKLMVTKEERGGGSRDKLSGWD